jgi:TatD DNase family protein
MIDTHCHLDVEAFAADRDDVLERASAAGVFGMLVPAIRPRTWDALRELAATRHALGVRWAVGIHPQVVPELAPGELAADPVRQLAAAAGDAIAIGETGLDGGTGERELQEELFRAHIRAARELGLPLVVHVLRAHDAAPRILREERAGDVGGILHSYSGGADLVGVYRDLGMAFSFAGPVTYANARRPIEAARAIPADLLLAETDAPDQSPQAHRGSRSEPAYVREVIAGLARARSEAVEAIETLTVANARRVLRAW